MKKRRIKYVSYIKNSSDAEENKELNKFNEAMSENFVWIKNSTCEQIGREVLTNGFLSEKAPKSRKKQNNI
jgi:hypothetical protein